MASSQIIWQAEELAIPHKAHRTPAIVARNVSYINNANARQNLNVYLPRIENFSQLDGKPFTRLPDVQNEKGSPRWHVHIHGGAWRDPLLRSSSIEAGVAIAFAAETLPIVGIVSIDYTLSPFPGHPTLPYDPVKGDSGDPSRQAQHPMHVSDVLHAFQFLRSVGLNDDSYILTGHSAGACLAFQTVLQPPEYWGIEITRLPKPAALIGLNGLYDLPGLVYGLGTSHEHLSGVYKDLLAHAFGSDEGQWPIASPARMHPTQLQERLRRKELPKLVLVDQSADDQLVPLNQADKMEAALKQTDGLLIVRGNRCKGTHAAPWEEGEIIWNTIQDVLALLAK